jgi:hypothetical protein
VTRCQKLLICSVNRGRVDEALGGFIVAMGADDGENWLPPRDSNPDNLLQRQVSCR